MTDEERLVLVLVSIAVGMFVTGLLLAAF